MTSSTASLYSSPRQRDMSLPLLALSFPTVSTSVLSAAAAPYPLSTGHRAGDASGSAAVSNSHTAPTSAALLSSPSSSSSASSASPFAVPSSVVLAAKDIVAGTIGGMTTVVVGHPLDTVKVRLQTSVGYSSTLDCMRRTWRGEGLRGFYKGVQSPLAGEAFFNAVQFLAYGQSKQLLASYRHSSHSPHHDTHSLQPAAMELTVADYFIAGGLTGAASCLVECPVDLLKYAGHPHSARIVARTAQQHRVAVLSVSTNQWSPAATPPSHVVVLNLCCAPCMPLRPCQVSAADGHPSRLPALHDVHWRGVVHSAPSRCVWSVPGHRANLRSHHSQHGRLLRLLRVAEDSADASRRRPFAGQQHNHSTGRRRRRVHVLVRTAATREHDDTPHTAASSLSRAGKVERCSGSRQVCVC